MHLLLSLTLLFQGTLGGSPGFPQSLQGSRDTHVGEPLPNVLVVLADDFNWDDIDALSLPNLAAFAGRGMTFRNAYAFPVCSTTRYSLIFGRYPRRDGIGRLVGIAPPSPDNPTPPLALRSLAEVTDSNLRGFGRSALIGKWHLGTHPGYDGNRAPDYGPQDIGALTPQLHGFDEFLAGTMSNLPQGLSNGDYFHWLRVDDGTYSVSDEYAPATQLEAFYAWWAVGRRRLALVAPNLPHAPFHDPPPGWTPRLPGSSQRSAPPGQNRLRFESMLGAFDLMLGRMLEVVDLSQTYVFVLADNGTQPSIGITPCPPQATFDGCTKGTVWQGGVNVPMWVAGPGIPPGSSTDALASSTDLMATIAELLDTPSPGEDSISFAPVLFDPAARTRRVAFTEIFGIFDNRLGMPELREESAAIGERYKLRVLNGEEFLYDLVLDPREASRLSTSAPEYAAALAQLRAVIANPLERGLQSH